MKRVFGASAFALAVCLCPAASRAELSLQIVARLPDPSSDRRFFDLVFNETGTPQNERLAVYDVGIRLVPIVGGARFTDYNVPGALDELTTSPNFVFSSSSLTPIEIDANHVLVDVSNTGPYADITSGMSAGRFSVTAGCGVYHLVLEGVFVDADANAIPVDLSGAVSMEMDCPEPASASLLAIATPLALRRRRAPEK